MKSRQIVLLAVVAAAVIAAVIVAYAILAPPDTPANSLALPELSTTETASIVESEEGTGSPNDPLATRRELAEAAPQAGTSESGAAAGTVGAAGAAAGTDAEGAESSGANTANLPDPESTGLTLAERKACYWDIIAAEDRAVAEAEAAYPMETENADISAHIALRIRLMGEYEAAILEEYDITPDELAAITDEGIRNAWPMPPLEG